MYEELKQLGDSAEKLKEMTVSMMEAGDLSEYEYLDLANKAEECAVNARLLVNGRRMMDLDSDGLPPSLGGAVHIQKDEDVLGITIGRMIPRRPEYKSRYVRYYYDLLYGEELEEYFLQNPFEPSKGKYVIWYEHIYRDLNGRDVLDHDNYETKVMTDLLVRFLAIDDSPRFLETSVSSEEGEKDETRITILPKERFAEILAKRKEEEEG